VIGEAWKEKRAVSDGYPDAQMDLEGLSLRFHKRMIGFRGEFFDRPRGEGVMNHSFSGVSTTQRKS